ncbi:MAG: hypothetical protein Q7T18_12970, partial [Sedimentisphaerales bacterium]|nr:hypothetical protein [Sedimentisphaerales bacterium]
MRQFEDVFKRFLIRAFVVVCFVAIGSVSVANAAGEEVKIPVIVNILRGADGNNVGAAIKKANKILENAHIKLVVEKTNNDVNVGDKNQDLTFDEGDEAQKKGQTELGGTFTDPNGKWNGKGVKITVGGDCWVGEPNTIGWSKHRNPVLVVEGGAEPNSLGGTIAHELFHILTVKK